MPYELIGNCVHKKGDKKPLKCYSKHADALAYLRALEANVSDAKTVDDKAYTGMLMQDEVNYVPLSTTAGKACANCRWFHATGDYMNPDPHCHLVMDMPEPILATGYCDRQETPPPMPMPDTEPVLVQIVEPPMEMDDSAEMALSVPKSIFQRVKEFAATLRPRATPEPQAFTVFKTATGKNAWIARHTGKWIDRENEILSEKSHEEYVERVQKGITPPPELWMWHAKGTKHGQAVAVWKSGGFVLAAGLFDDTAEGQRMFDYYQKHSGKIKLSHMFHYPKATKLNGVYHAYNTIEITTLPDGAEAFPYTSFEEIQTMALPEVARNMILEAGGQEMLDRAVANDSKAESDTKTLDDQGVAWKGYDKYGVEFAPAEKVAALETAQKSVEETLKGLTDIPATIKALNDSVKSLTEQLTAELEAKAVLIEKINALESQQALLTDLKPPASKSNETLLENREKSFLDKMMEAAQKSDAPSLIDQLVGGHPAIHS